MIVNALLNLRQLIHQDHDHWNRRGFSHPILYKGYQATILHRLSYAAHAAGWPILAWLLWLINNIWAGADLPPSSRIAGGFFLPYPHGVVVAGRVGVNAAVGMHVVVGGLLREPEHDIGGGPGLPVIGDGVSIEGFATILGMVRVGDHAWIAPGAIVRHDVEPSETAVGPT